jgi:hypothetical protein
LQISVFISGQSPANGLNFGISMFLQGTLAFSRILMKELLLVANTDPANPCGVCRIVDLTLSQCRQQVPCFVPQQGAAGTAESGAAIRGRRGGPSQKRLAAAAVGR